MIESLYKEITTTTIYSDSARTKEVTVNVYKPDLTDYSTIIHFLTVGLSPLYITKKDEQTLTPFQITQKCIEKFEQILKSNNEEESQNLMINLFVFNQKGIDYLKNIIQNVFFELDINKLTFTALVNCFVYILTEGSNITP